MGKSAVPMAKISQVTRSGTLPARVTWAALPLTVGPALGDALGLSSRAVELTGATLAWATWAIVLAAVLVPRTTSLTAVRVAAPAVLAAAIWAGVVGDVTATDLLAVGWAALTVVAVFAPQTGDAFVNGSSYGSERRMPLRAPAALLAGPILIAWAAVVGPLVGGPLLVAAGATFAGIAVLVLGLPLAWVAARALHGLARRWVVFVPAGLVLHDLMALAEPVLFSRAGIRRLGPAPADTDALDLTRGALGLALELEVGPDPIELVPLSGRQPLTAVRVERVLFTPTRPGALLAEATRRRIRVG